MSGAMKDEEAEFVAALCEVARATEEMMGRAYAIQSPALNRGYVVATSDMRHIGRALDRWKKAKEALHAASTRPSDPPSPDDTIPDANALFQVNDGPPIPYAMLLRANPDLNDAQRELIERLDVGKKFQFSSQMFSPIVVRRTR